MKSAPALLLQGLNRNLKSGVRLAAFLPVSHYDFRVSPGDFALLWLFNLLVWLAGGMLRVGLSGHIDFAALPAALAEIPLLLLACAIIAYWYRRHELQLRLALLLISTDAVFELVSSAIALALQGAGEDASPAAHLAVYSAYLVWVLTIFLRTLWVAAGWQRRQFIPSGVLLIALFLVLENVMPRTELWAVAEDDVTGQPSIVQEELFHAQDGLLDARLAALQPQRAGISDLYFVGFAPDGTEDVFGRELATVARLMSRRFDGAGRSLLLANDPSTLGDLPVASATNLRIALAHIGRIMNVDEDLLFLYITSHGSENGELSVALPPLELSQIRPAALARMLHQSGIKWKVLVISACYSGGFIEPLKDDNTLIITATDANNQSFGCGNGQKLTWFGKAYFDEALRRTRSFTEAFGLARDAVALREREQKFTPSNPQMNIGRAMSDKLRSLETRLAAPGQ
ncbi:MAG: peptidase [Betaproteobacteria bacterium]|nr:MAG: peptidase [Betaproteobacteria bacterium]